MQGPIGALVGIVDWVVVFLVPIEMEAYEDMSARSTHIVYIVFSFVIYKSDGFLYSWFLYHRHTFGYMQLDMETSKKSKQSKCVLAADSTLFFQSAPRS